jgi:pyridoxal phosphate-dependent aminotransferase EpsN
MQTTTYAPIAGLKPFSSHTKSRGIVNERVYLSPPHMNGREMAYIEQAFAANWIAPLGENVDAFEDAVKSYVHMPHALGVSSGTAALHLALMVAGVKSGDVVLCSDVTFAASCNPIVYLGAEPAFVDCDAKSWCMDPAPLEDALRHFKKAGRLPRAVIVVDLYGLPADYDRILGICAAFGVPVIEDAAEALGASYKGKMCGSFGALNILSFNANKIITTSSGGMVLAQDGRAIEKMKFWATQAREPQPYYEHKEIGYNYRLSNICAGIGRGQMETLDAYVGQRRAIHRRYAAGLAGLPVSMNPVISGAKPNFWLSVMVFEDGCGMSPDEVADALARENIETRPFWKPMHMQPVYRDCLFFHAGRAPVGEALFQRALCLPSGSAMSAVVQDRIIGIIQGCFRHAGAKTLAEVCL